MKDIQFIEEKKQKKFELFWDKIIRKLPKSNKEHLEKKDCSFYKKETRIIGETCIVCNKLTQDNPHKVLSGFEVIFYKRDLLEAFLDFKSYVKEIRQCLRGATEKLHEQFPVDSKIRLQNNINRLTAEIDYAKILFSSGGFPIINEIEIDDMREWEIGKYVNRLYEEKKYKNIYFEFQEYGKRRLNFFISKKLKTRDILSEDKYKRLSDFCESNNIETGVKLLMFPFYSKSMVEKYGSDLLRDAILTIKVYIEIKTMEYNGVDILDVDDLL